MPHRSLKTLLVWLALALPGWSDDRPNIIFLMADDQCTYSLGCYGTPGAKTPNLDTLAREGVVFDRHYDTTAICMASRASVMTGLFEYRTGCNFDSGPLVREIWSKSYPMLLREAGYRTAFAGKFGFEVVDQPGAKKELPESDFDRWGGGPGQTSYDTRKNKSMAAYADEYPHSTRSYGAFGRDFIADVSQSGDPFCLSISFKAPHHPVQPDPIFDEVYADSGIPKPANYGREHGEHFSEQSRQGRQYERFDSWGYRDNYLDVMRRYFQQIYAIDVAVGMIREALETNGVADNTVIIYTSDNGFLCGSHGYGSKVLPYEESTRVPLIIKDPRQPNAGRRCDSLTGNVDFAPTILEYAGLAIPDGLDGQSLLPLMKEPNTVTERVLPLINVWGPRECHCLGVVSNEGKYIYWPFADKGFEATPEAYDFSSNRLELTNILDEPAQAGRVQQLESQYNAALEHWRQHAVPYHGYPRFATIFDPDVSWNKKAPLYAKPKKR